MIKILNDKQLILHQGDIIKDVELVENVIEQDGNITVSKIVFPYIIVLTQDCDLTWDYNNRNSEKTIKISILFQQSWLHYIIMTSF